MQSRIVSLILSLISLSHASSSLYPVQQGSCPVPKVVEVWQSAVTATEWATHTAYAACADCEPTGAVENAAYISAGQRYSQSVTATPVWSNTAAPTTTQTLYPTPHWDHDASNPDVLVPSHDTQTYYGPSNKTSADTAHTFQWINASLSSPAVVLDHSDLLTYTWSNASATLSIQFTSDQAYKLAESTWNTSIILVAYTPGCGNYEGGDGCYVAVHSLAFDALKRSCQATGNVQTLKQCMQSIDASWGQYIPASGAPVHSSPIDHASITSSVYSSVYSSVLSKYPQYLSELSSYMSKSIYGGVYGVGKTTSATHPIGTITSGSGPWNTWSGGSRTSMKSAVPTSSGMQYGNQQSNSYAIGSTFAGYDSATITSFPSTTTSLSPSVSRISSSLSAYLSSLSASYSRDSSSSGSVSSDGIPNDSTSVIGTATVTGTLDSVSPSVTGSTPSTSGGFGSTEDGTHSSTVTSGGSNISTSDVTATMSSLSSASDGGTSTTSIASSSDGASPSTATGSSTTISGTIATTTSKTIASLSSSTTPSSPLPTCVNTLPRSCSNLVSYNGGALDNPMNDCATDLYGLTKSGEIDDNSLNPAYACIYNVDQKNKIGKNVEVCIAQAVVCGYSRTFSTTVTGGTTTMSSRRPTSTCTQGQNQLGLPTYCVGPDFDTYLDSIQGFLTLDNTDFAQITQLFPGIFPVLVKRSYENRLENRCDGFLDCGGAVISFITSAGGNGVGIITSAGDAGVGIITSAAGAFTSDLVNAGGSISSAANGIISAAQDRGQQLSQAAAQAIAELEQGINAALSYDKSGHIPLNIAAPESALHDSPWGPAVLIHSFGHGGNKSDEKTGAKRLARKATDFSLNVFCVDCSVRGSVDIQGTLRIDTDGIHQFSVSVDVSDMEVNLGVGLDAKAEWSEEFKVNLFQQGIPDLCSGTTLCIGPYVKMDASLTLDVEAEGYLLAGGKWIFSDAHVNLDGLTGSASQSNWSPSFQSNINAGGEVTLTATVGTPLTVGVGITVLNGAISKNIEVEVLPTVTGQAQAAMEASHDAGGTVVHGGSIGDCAGIYISSYWQVVLSYNILDLKEGEIYNTESQPIAAACIPWDFFVPGDDNADGNSNTGFGNGSGNGSPLATSARLISRSDGTPLQICSDGNVYNIASDGIATDCSADWLAYADDAAISRQYDAAQDGIRHQILESALKGRPYTGPMTPDRAAITRDLTSVVSSGSRRIAVVFPNTSFQAGVSRFRIVDVNRIPSQATFVQFEYVDELHGRVAHDLSGTRYSAVACVDSDASPSAGRRQVFFVPYGQESRGIAQLSSDILNDSVTNGPVGGCQVLALDMARSS